MHQFLKLGLFLSLGFVLLTSGTHNAWSLAKDKHDVQIYTRKTSHSNFKEFKAITTVNGTVDQILGIVLDIEGYSGWMDKVKSAKVVERVSDTELVQYAEVSAPVVSNRDFYVRMHIRPKAADGSVRVDFKAEPNYAPKVKGLVRLTRSDGYWLLTPKADGKVHIYQQVDADPGGGVPAWLANGAVVDTPFTSFVNLRKKLGQH